MIYFLIPFGVMVAVGFVGATVEALFSGSGEEAPGEDAPDQDEHPYADVHVPSSLLEDGAAEEARPPTLPHFGRFDNTAFESVDYKALIAGAEERMDQLSSHYGSDL